VGSGSTFLVLVDTIPRAYKDGFMTINYRYTSRNWNKRNKQITGAQFSNDKKAWANASTWITAPTYVSSKNTKIFPSRLLSSPKLKHI